MSEYIQSFAIATVEGLEAPIYVPLICPVTSRHVTSPLELLHLSAASSLPVGLEQRCREGV